MPFSALLGAFTLSSADLIARSGTIELPYCKASTSGLLEIEGNSLFRSRCLIGASATLLAASSVSVGGLIGFVGLIVPHAVRFLFGTDYKVVLPFSALLGAFTLSSADLIARSGTIELPVGIITSLFGAPIFIVLLYKRQKSLTSLR